jgi:hypothetical protein
MKSIVVLRIDMCKKMCFNCGAGKNEAVKKHSAVTNSRRSGSGGQRSAKGRRKAREMKTGERKRSAVSQRQRKASGELFVYLPDRVGFRRTTIVAR